MATAEAIGKCAKAEAKIKWPNDIILNNKKVAGILVESKKGQANTPLTSSASGLTATSKKQSFPAELQKTATSIDIETGRFTDRISLIKRLLTSVDHWLDVAEQNKEKVIERWRRLSTQLGSQGITCLQQEEVQRQLHRHRPEKGLILQLDTGGIRMFHAAQTTIAKE